MLGLDTLSYWRDCWSLEAAEIASPFSRHSDERDARNAAAWDRMCAHLFIQNPDKALLKTIEILEEGRWISYSGGKLREHALSSYTRLVRRAAKNDLKRALKIRATIDCTREAKALALSGFLDKIFDIDLEKGFWIAYGVLTSAKAQPSQKENAAAGMIKNFSAFADLLRINNPKEKESWIANNSLFYLENALCKGAYSNANADIEQTGLELWRQNILILADREAGGSLYLAADRIETFFRYKEYTSEKPKFHDAALLMWKTLIVDRLAETDLEAACKIACELVGAKKGNACATSEKSDFTLLAEVVYDELSLRLKARRTDVHARVREKFGFPGGPTSPAC
jgi:hypothetical protein